MATRQTRLVIKNNSVPNAPFSGATLLKGEAIVNTADGILMFSGITSSTSEWTPAGPGDNANFFEVGSNLYDLRLRNRITKYEDQTGSGLVGKFLSGTTNGFVLADISDIQGIDSYVTGATWSPDLLTLDLNNGKPSVSVTIDEFHELNVKGLVVNDFTIADTGIYNNVANGSNINEIVNWSSLTTYTSNNDRYVTGGTYDNNTSLITFNGANGFPAFNIDLSLIDVNNTYSTGGTVTQFATNNNNEQIVNITGNDGFTPYNITGLTDTFVTGFTFSSNTLTISQNNGVDLTANINGIDLSGVLSAITFDINTTGDITATSFSGTSFSGGTFYGDGSNLTGINNYYVTGGTISYVGADGTITLTRNDNVNVTIPGITDTYTTGATLVGSTAYFNTNDSLSAYTLDLSSFVPTGDTFVTGFTYTPTSNTFTISQDGGPTLTTQINSVSGLSISNLTAGRVVYVGTGGLLTDESGFEYNDGTNLLTVGNINVQNASGTTANIGQGGLIIGSGGSLSTPGIGDLTVHGNLTVFGTETIVATTELYIEDPQITLNYNPTSSTIATSVASGIRIQDGNGVTNGDTYFTIGQMQNLTSGDTSEYTGLTGYINRGWVTQLNDIVIRNTNLNEGAPDGVRVLAEGDILDGGQY